MMKRYLLALLLAAVPARAHAQVSRFPNPVQVQAPTLATTGGVIRAGTADPEGSVVGWVGDVYLRRTTTSVPNIYVKRTGVGTNTGWEALLTTSGAGAPTTATYITQTADSTLTNEQALGALASGYVKNTTTTGVLTTQAAPIPVADGGTGQATYTKGDVLASPGPNTLNKLAVGTDGQILTADAASTNGIKWATPSGGSTHALLSATHTDTAAATVVRGDLVVGNSTPAWGRFAKCSTNFFIKYSSTDPACFDLFGTANTFSLAQTFSGSNAANTHVVFKNSTADAAIGGIDWQGNTGTLYWQIIPNFQVAAGLEINEGANNRVYLAPSAGPLFYHDTSNAKMTAGLTINQGASDDEIFALKSSDVGHGVTTETETDTYALLQKRDAASGGGWFRFFNGSSATGSARVEGIVTTATAVRSTSATAPIELRASLKSGTTTATMGADKNLVVATDNGTTKWIVDSDGDTWQTGGHYERSRTVAQGEWIDVACASGNFTANGSMTWTVDCGGSPDQQTYHYTLVGKTVTVSFVIDASTVGGTPSTQLKIALPSGIVPAKTEYFTLHIVDNSTQRQGVAVIAAATATIYCYADATTTAAWAASTNLTGVHGSITFEIQ